MLSRRMSLRAFENGYWYQTELVAFGKSLGLPAAHRMRKNELVPAIKTYLETGRLPRTVSAKPLKKGTRDLDAGLSLRLTISNYTSNRETKDFLRQSARKKDPGVAEKPGVWYRLNRWREAEVAKRAVTYGELVERYIALNRLERFDRIPYDCYVNFLSEYLENEKDATHKQARAAWKKLKALDAPKNYRSWKEFFPSLKP